MRFEMTWLVNVVSFSVIKSGKMLLFACRNRDIADEGSLSEHEISMGEDSSGRPETGDRNISKKDKNKALQG